MLSTHVVCGWSQVKTRELESRVRVLEAQVAISAAPSMHHSLAAPPGLRLMGGSSGLSHDGQSILAALAAAGLGSTGNAAAAGGAAAGSGGVLSLPGPGPAPARPPLVTSAGLHAPGALSLLGLGPSSAAAPPAGLSLPLLDARLEAGMATAGSGWMLDSASLSQLASLGLPPMAMLPQGLTVALGAGQGHAVLRTLGSGGASDSQASKEGARGRK